MKNRGRWRPPGYNDAGDHHHASGEWPEVSTTIRAASEDEFTSSRIYFFLKKHQSPPPYVVAELVILRVWIRYSFLSHPDRIFHPSKPISSGIMNASKALNAAQRVPLIKFIGKRTVPSKVSNIMYNVIKMQLSSNRHSNCRIYRP